MSGDQFVEALFLVAPEAEDLVVAEAALGTPDAALDGARTDVEYVRATSGSVRPS